MRGSFLGYAENSIYPSGQRRIGPAAGVLAVHALLGYALFAGWAAGAPHPPAERLTTLTLLPAPPLPPPSPEPPPKPARPARDGGASPGEPAPRLPHVIPAPPMLAPAPTVFLGPPAAAPRAPGGDGDRAGGGEGTGAGDGAGPGEGDGDAAGWTSARQIAGGFRRSDFPRSARAADLLRLGVEFAIGPDGRVAACRVLRSSGYPEVDAMTCDVIRRRYRFEPARDDRGEPVTEVWEEDEVWTRGRWER